MSDIKLGKPELELAKRIGHKIWDSYDDTHGYRTEKQAYNDSVNTDILDNIWAFWGQFDHYNQEKFLDLVTWSNENGATKLEQWIEQRLDKSRGALEELRKMGLDI
jgi:hypothetical protein